MLEHWDTGVPDIVCFRLSGKVLQTDYRALAPCIEAVVEREGCVKLFAELEDLHGLDWHAVWDEIKFGARHYRNIKRIAMVSDRKWEQRLVGLFKPFTRAEVRYFNKDRINAAWYWLQDEEE